MKAQTEIEKATPRPWKLEAFHKRLECGPVTIKDVSDSGYANAKLIVKAVNAHDDLLAVAKGAYGWLKALPKDRQPDDEWFIPLQEAIAKAEGK